MNESKQTGNTVETFLTAFEGGDFETIAGCLCPDHFSFEGPIDSFDNAADFIQDLEKYALILKRIERRRLFVDDREACAVLTFITNISDIESTRVVVWVKTDSTGLIQRIESFLDVRAYERMFEAAASAKSRV